MAPCEKPLKKGNQKTLDQAAAPDIKHATTQSINAKITADKRTKAILLTEVKVVYTAAETKQLGTKIDQAINELKTARTQVVLTTSGANYYRGNGFSWAAKPQSETLEIDATNVRSVEFSLIANGQVKQFKDRNDEVSESVQIDGGTSATAPLTFDGSVGAISFYPVGAKLDADTPNVDLSHDHIFIRISNNDFVQVFERR